MEIIINSLSELGKTAKMLLNEAGQRRVFVFDAPMGAGKTTLISAICKELGAAPDIVASPTFSIINEYPLGDGSSAFHFDFYRIESYEESVDTGAEDYLESGAYCFVEWPEKSFGIIPDDAFNVRIRVGSFGERIITTD